MASAAPATGGTGVAKRELRKVAPAGCAATDELPVDRGRAPLTVRRPGALRAGPARSGAAG